MNSLEFLSAAEQDELLQRPIDKHRSAFTPEQINRRKEIGQKIFQFFLERDPTMTDEIRTLYLQTPLWQFYKTANNQIVRPYGVGRTNQGLPISHVLRCKIGRAELEDREMTDLIPVINWSADDQHVIRFTAEPGVFLDPLGFLLILMDLQGEENGSN